MDLWGRHSLQWVLGDIPDLGHWEYWLACLRRKDFIGAHRKGHFLSRLPGNMRLFLATPVVPVAERHIHMDTLALLYALLLIMVLSLNWIGIILLFFLAPFFFIAFCKAIWALGHIEFRTRTICSSLYDFGDALKASWSEDLHRPSMFKTWWSNFIPVRQGTTQWLFNVGSHTLHAIPWVFSSGNIGSGNLSHGR